MADVPGGTTGSDPPETRRLDRRTKARDVRWRVPRSNR